MVSHLRRAEISHRKDPHGWNSWDHYQSIHNRRLSEHPFVAGFQDTLAVSVLESAGVIRFNGFVQCEKGVLLEVTKELSIESDNRGRMYVRCYSYRYIGRVPRSHVLLKYHNRHDDPDEYHHRVYNPATGEQLFHENIQRYQFPTFPEVLDELEFLARDL